MLSRLRNINKLNITFNTNKNYNTLLQDVTKINNEFSYIKNDEIIKFLLDYRSLNDYKNYDIDIIIKELKELKNLFKTTNKKDILDENILYTYMNIKRNENLNNLHTKHRYESYIWYSIAGTLCISPIVYNLVKN